MSQLEGFSELFKQAFVDELHSARAKIVHCLNQLSDNQIWWRPREDMNSIANLILHLSGNVRQWIVSGVGGTSDNRDRPREFSERSPLTRQELSLRLKATVQEASQVILTATQNRLEARLSIQGFAVSGVEAILHSIAHFRGHTQEIVHLTRLQLDSNYIFDFVPTTPEQGA
ncbi:MAG: DUF1572 family protein [Planctomycetales bacterium]|nr:DUF1572 family protein [Planctomycetales bacterium]